jgi:hypothetical protein
MQLITLGFRPPAGFPEWPANDVIMSRPDCFQGGLVHFKHSAIRAEQADELKLQIEDRAEPCLGLGQCCGALGNPPLQFRRAGRLFFTGCDDCRDILLRADQAQHLAIVAEKRLDAHRDPTH